jgi:23S rRNA (cytosine1962-C5)-methyltransferase
MVFGGSDGLPGLIVDSFKNCALAQINTAGLDQFREKIKSELATSLGSPVFFLDNEEYRKAEGLPNYESELEINALEVSEGGLHFELSKNRIQKVGFYYDHRENRAKLSGMISRMNKKFQKGLDLFCYAGAWGMTMAKSGVAAVDFVDQADLASDFDRNLELNDLSGEHRFHRKDGFQFLKEIRNEYDIIVSDPPAFAKSPKGKKKALEGYQKLHRLCLRAIKNNSYFAACSCTRYVDLKEFLSTVEHAAKLSGSKVTLIDIGTQGLDHPCYGLDDKANYLKYGLFLVEKL